MKTSPSSSRNRANLPIASLRSSVMLVNPAEPAHPAQAHAVVLLILERAAASGLDAHAPGARRPECPVREVIEQVGGEHEPRGLPTHTKLAGELAKTVRARDTACRSRTWPSGSKSSSPRGWHARVSATAGHLSRDRQS